MKSTFFNLPETKRQKIIDSCISEFGKKGYDKGSTDGIIRRSGISKGGLYEYIDSKEDLYLFIVDYCYARLYDFIQDDLRKKGNHLPEDILERLRLVYTIAIDFYLAHPAVIEFIVKTNALTNRALVQKVQTIFQQRFTEVFGESDTSRLAFDKNKILDLLMWLLLKTRNDFLSEISMNKDLSTVKKAYFEDWDFFILVLKKGIYQ